jgi:repressor LexA
MERENLHKTQQELLRLIEENRDYPLSQRDLQDALSLSSVSVVQHHIKQLEKKGFLRRNPSNPRDYTIVDSKIAYLNIYGQAECGPDGSVLTGDPIATMPLSTDLLRGVPSNCFVVRATGESMKPRIFPGDLVIASSTNYANDGDVVVCVNNYQTLIKQIRKTPNGLVLYSFNELEFEPFEPAEDFRVEGIVTTVITYQI